MSVNIPAASSYTRISIPNINVTNGYLEIGFYSVGNGGNWITFDNIELTGERSANTFYGGKASGTVLGTSNNKIINFVTPFTYTYRTYIKPHEYGDFMWSLWYSNSVDSTWADGALAYANQPGSTWRIDAAYVADGGTSPDGSVVSGTQQQVSYGASTSKLVRPGETFWSNPVQINIPSGHYLAFTWTIATYASGSTIPYTYNSMVTAFQANGSYAGSESGTPFSNTGDYLVAPNLFAYNKPVTKNIAFLGDSITQGISTTRDAYAYWVSKIADGMPTDKGIWNLGSGYARAQDAASDGRWLNKVKTNDEINICLGVNDIGTGVRTASQIVADLTTIVSKIKQENPSATVILFTIPPFNFTAAAETTWRSVNQTIRTSPPAGVDRVFDIAAVLSQAAPNDNNIQVQYLSPNNDPHPNGLAGTAVANAYLSWY
ncbi:SGNH/GDSL hydrolase family protein [Paenibacillus alba]|nr:SGNH/GDSL hydrolase family protein [Paenibacillus alba]